MNKLKKSIRCISISLLMSLFFVQNSQAQSNVEILLAKIAETTNRILAEIQLTPVYLKTITEMADSWMDTKENKVIANNQFAFVSLNQNDIKRAPEQLSLSQKLTREFLVAGNNDPKVTSLPFNANELSYSTLMGQPLVATKAKLEQLTQRYIKNASGSNLLYMQFNPKWPDSDAKKQYIGMYNAAATVTSYNTYILSNLYKQDTQNKIRKNLVDQASNSDWFKKVASESLGLVLRQMLMYTSQIYVQLDRSIKIQQQQLTTQAMTNTLLLTNMNATVQAFAQQAQMARPIQ